MSATQALSANRTTGILPKAFSPRRRRLRQRLQPATAASTVKPSGSISALSLGLVAAVSLLLSLLACSFIVTGLAVWVANGAAEWLAAVVPALLAALLFGFAWRMVKLLDNTGR